MKKHVCATSHSPAIICFSVTNIHSFHAIESSWLEEANHFHPRGIPKIIIGNKVDLRTHHAGEGEAEKKQKNRSQKQIPLLPLWMPLSPWTGTGRFPVRRAWACRSDQSCRLC
ncbi:hypothetical protein, variant 2 [Blastomyces gilchristii SLH14081]|uniref:Uncharacterized protein n=1 Tax=Blastomyces gilchristii (strain SLH14081) TaxID=559298 RepID=A0A179UNF5_BLAGS|nr:uncharacterized protein BDBG_04880 [Blastomyces gilchristii SLH14081]XP_031578383.1 hypothetical protein, variant 1 [Blastomyces gilchristii SLH14081]XP_031578384.1 hypothetical protein, variant 2 [Blastomyces gilchristii SLH14081]OAT08625.1 hypothetical protein BDBG_04880 [Blastomyces gilchristii SLH14081]OAT08626.1 hypothetical protein, variant 1 [Blastomyces gilchristii SLH14081]OAT08627.1 hypothetical protein, variant 2 [Blastomyces gilchristii SLH14081]